MFIRDIGESEVVVGGARRGAGGMPAGRVAAGLVALALVAAPLAGPAAAQDGADGAGRPDAGAGASDAAELPETAWFPDRRWFRSPMADPLEPRFGVGLISTDLFDTEAPWSEPPYVADPPADAKRDVQAAASVGGTLPLWRAAPWRRGGVVVGVQAGVFARFRMEHPSRHAVATDWVVALPVEAARGPVSGRLRLLHRSAHLGDELIESNGARRIEFAHEAVELLLAYRIGGTARVYGGGSWVFRSNTDDTLPLLLRGGNDRGALQAGADVVAYPWAKGRVGYVAGIDWQAADRTAWDGALSVVAGFTARSSERSVRLVVRRFSGAAAVGEFFLSDESYWGIELVLTL